MGMTYHCNSIQSARRHISDEGAKREPAPRTESRPLIQMEGEQPATRAAEGRLEVRGACEGGSTAHLHFCKIEE